MSDKWQYYCRDCARWVWRTWCWLRKTYVCPYCNRQLGDGAPVRINRLYAQKES